MLYSQVSAKGTFAFGENDQEGRDRAGGMGDVLAWRPDREAAVLGRQDGGG